MSKFFYTSTQLLASIKRRAFVPESQTTFSDQDFLDFATEEMNMGIVPTVMTSQQDYYLDEKIIPLVNDQLKYEIPYRAIGNKLRDISLVDSNGNRTSMTRTGLGDQVYSNGNTNNDAPYSYFMTGNEINLMNTSGTNIDSYSLAIAYYLRPNTLVPNEEVGTITAINGGVITLSEWPEAFTADIDYDFIQFKSPHKILGYDITSTVVNSTLKTITFSATNIPARLQVGDKLSLATETCIPQIPSDMHVMLAVRVASQVLAALGDTEGLQTSNQKLAELEVKTQTLIHDRVEDSPQKIVNRHGTLRRSRSHKGYR